MEYVCRVTRYFAPTEIGILVVPRFVHLIIICNNIFQLLSNLKNLRKSSYHFHGFITISSEKFKCVIMHSSPDTAFANISLIGKTYSLF